MAYPWEHEYCTLSHHQLDQIHAFQYVPSNGYPTQPGSNKLLIMTHAPQKAAKKRNL